MCEANALLTKRYGTVGQVIGSLSSNVLAKAFSGAQDEHFHTTQKAAHSGRGSKASCDIYPKCINGDLDERENIDIDFGDTHINYSNFIEDNEIKK